MSDGKGKVIYLAEYYSGAFRVSSVSVIKETAKQYQVDQESIEKLFGDYIVHCSGRVNKSGDLAYSSLGDALAWGLGKVDSDLAQVKNRLERIQKCKAEIEAAMGAK